MATLSARKAGSVDTASGLCLIVGLACLAGFAVDFFILAIPPNLRAVQWRVGIAQQLADRSIVLLFGMALIFYGTAAARSWRRLIAYGCLALGGIYLLSCLVVLRDSNTLNRQVVNRIDQQATQLQTQISQAQSDPQAPPELTPEIIQQASDRLATQANQLKDNSKQSIFKAGVSSIGNLLVTGVSFLALGLYGSRLARF